MNSNQSNENIILEDENKCHICDIEFEQLELHFLISHTSQTVINKKDNDLSKNINNSEELVSNENEDLEKNNPKIFLDHTFSEMEESRKTSKCFICEQDFCQEDLKAHFLVCDQEHKCGICGNIFQTDNLLKNHKAIHGKVLKHQSKKHIHIVHDGQKDYKCESCDKPFSEEGDLKRHKYTIHEGHKEYRCDICDRLFSQTQQLKNHIHTVHKVKKDYKCDSVIAKVATLRKHIHTNHGRKRKYKCYICCKLISTKGKLNEHILTVHEGDKVKKCESCGKSFSKVSSLKRHINSVH